MNEPIIEQLRTWAEELEDRDGVAAKDISAVVAEMRQVATDLEADNEANRCLQCGSIEGAYVPPGSGDAFCLHCGADWMTTEPAETEA